MVMKEEKEELEEAKELFKEGLKKIFKATKKVSEKIVEGFREGYAKDITKENDKWQSSNFKYKFKFQSSNVKYFDIWASVVGIKDPHLISITFSTIWFIYTVILFVNTFLIVGWRNLEKELKEGITDKWGYS